MGTVVVLVSAAAAGLWMGFQAHQTAEELAQGRPSQIGDLLNFRAEADRLLHEIWKMEEIDRSIYNRQAPW